VSPLVSDISSEGRYHNAASERGDIRYEETDSIALIALAGLGSASLASAQERQLRGQIPFSFTAGSAQLSAGEYRITYDLSGLVAFRNVDNGSAAMTFVGADLGVKDGRCKLVFARYGDRYLLKQSQCDAVNTNFFVPTSGLEKKAVEQAAVQVDDERIAIAMR
jgi:hypothetical protein